LITGVSNFNLTKSEIACGDNIISLFWPEGIVASSSIALFLVKSQLRTGSVIEEQVA